MTESSELTHWVLLHSVPGLGPVIFKRLLDRFGAAEKAVEANLSDLSSIRGVSSELAEALSGCRYRMAWAERTVAELPKNGVRILRIGDSSYPLPLLDLPNPPPLLYIYGDVSKSDLRSIGMVGTTRPSDRGRSIAERFAAKFASAGITVVSGYAHGIDAASHCGAFKAGGRSILCIPFGIRRFASRPDFPSLSEIARRGAVVSECPPDQEWSSPAAVARNRIIAALGRALFVVETRPRGGTMHTVRAAEELARPIFALKYRQPPESARGNSIIIARGGNPVTTFGEVSEILRLAGIAESE